ncbi:RNA-directed DNA polymerase, eukaryota [Tanacetum coccineum]
MFISHSKNQNQVRFEREHKPKQPGTFNKKDTRTGVPKAGVPCTMPSGIPRGSFASILKEGSPSLSNPDLQTPAIVLEDSCLKERDFSMSLMGKLKRLERGRRRRISLKGLSRKPYLRLDRRFSSIKPASNSFVSDERIVWVSLEGLPINVWTMNTFSKVAAKWGDLVVWEDSEENSLSCLIDIPLGGYSYTWSHKLASKMSKLDRFLIFEGLMAMNPTLSCLCLDRHLSDHRPIIMFESLLDYGPTPFRMFHSWFEMEGFYKFVEDSWQSIDVVDSNGLIRMEKKLQCLKSSIKTWVKDSKSKKNEAKSYVQDKLTEVDKHIDQVGGNDEILQQRATLMKDLHDINSIDVLELSQKRKVQWSIEGDENSKYFHGIINNKRSQLAIRGILIDGDWISDLKEVKSEFLNHFAKQFSKPSSPRISINGAFPNRLNLEQVEELESSISQDEIKKAVWDYGTNKSPGPDGFTFEFFQKYWNVLKQDIVAAIHQFFDSGKFPPDCNSSFIALIPKIQDAKIVKDFRPISLIRSIYKIIAKILANRLSIVMPDLIGDVQTDFVSNRQILDDPFILNELLARCKHKKVNAMIFKVDFGKAFDSVRWDYLDDVLRSFGFGDKWRKWIYGCLNSVRGSVLINGSPTTKVLEAGLYKGISINNSLMISHLFYADDAVFVGKWDISNIKVIVNVLKFFFLASGLKINLHKSKLMGIEVGKEDIDSAAQMVGCSTFSPPFHYLRVKVGASMSRLNSWKEIINKISSRLSKWKLKTLSIGGRLSLLKSVLTTIPIYFMSLFKVPAGILKDLKSIRLGVASFYSTNRALLFKWIWRVFNDGSSLCSRFIKAIHGVRGAMDSQSVPTRGSKLKGIDLLALMKRKLGNGENTLFWDDIWSGGVESAQFRDLCDITSNVLLPQMQDRWSWSLNASDVFSVSSVRNFIDDAILPKKDAPTRWVKLVPIKINILAWKIYLDRLPTRLNLSGRGLDILSILCPLCNESVESTSHIFFSCSLARQVMRKVCR